MQLPHLKTKLTPFEKDASISCVPIQREIVRILDNFTEITAKKRYEYYRDSLLTFGDEVEWKTFSEFGEMLRKYGLKRKTLQKMWRNVFVMVKYIHTKELL